MGFSIFRSVAKSTKESIREKFRKAPEILLYPSPLGFRIGAAVELDTLELRMLADKLNFSPPDNTQIIASYGRVDMGDGTVLHRFYSTDDVMFQVTTVGGNDDEHVDEIKMFVTYDTVYPVSDEDWEFWIHPDEGVIGDAEFEIKDGSVFTRAWFEDTTNHASPIEYTEKIVTCYDKYDEDDDDLNDHETTIIAEHYAMLYYRWVDEAEEIAEWLFIDAEDTGTGSSIELLIGIDLSEGSLTIS